MEVYDDLAQAERQRATGGPYHEMTRLALAGEEMSLLVDSVTQAFLGWYGVWQQNQRQHRVVLDILQTWAEDAAEHEPARAAVQQLIEQVWRRPAQGPERNAPRYFETCLFYPSPRPPDRTRYPIPSSALKKNKTHISIPRHNQSVTSQISHTTLTI